MMIANFDTIVAVATAPGRGGIGIVRLSGPLSYQIAQNITKKKFLPRVAKLVDIFADDSSLIDQGIVIYYKAPHSFTGEDIIEFQCHGAPVVLDQIVELCVIHGARLALPGEFSEQAFLNNKIDLAKAEAIADLINSQSRQAAKMAARSLQGEFSNRVNALAEQLLNLRLFVEAAIDFPDEDLDFISQGQVLDKLESIKIELQLLLTQSKQGTILREGIKIVIAGPPNAGKSTLFNYFSGYEAAIVTDQPGTTRDLLKESIIIDGLIIHLLDSAGIRNTNESIEEEGIKRAVAAMQQADLIIWMVDGSIDDISMPNFDLSVPIIYVMNKQDLHIKSNNNQVSWILISMKSHVGLEDLKKAIKNAVGFSDHETYFLARRRHITSITEAFNLINHGIKNFGSHKYGDLLAEDLRLAHDQLGMITGKISADELLGHIFSNFCIGK